MQLRPVRLIRPVIIFLLFFHMSLPSSGENSAAGGPFTPDSGGIVVGCDRDYPPLSFLDSNIPQGFDVDLLGSLSLRAGIPIGVRPDSWSRVVEDLKTGKIDAVSGILYTRERSDWFDFTIPYLTESYTLFARRSSGIRETEDMPGRTAAILRDDAAVDSFLVPYGLVTNLILTDSFAEAMSMVAEGTADYTIAPITLGESLLHRQGNGSRIWSGRPLFQAEYRMAVRKGNSALLYVLNEAISEMKASGELQKLVRSRRFYSPFSSSAVPPTSPVLTGLLLAALFLGLGGFLWWLALKYRIQRATRFLDRRNRKLIELLDSVPFPLYWRDREFRIRGQNREMKTLLRLEAVGSRLSGQEGETEETFLPPSVAEEDRRTLATGLPGEQKTILASRGTGSPWLHRSIPLKDSTGKLWGILGCFLDLSREENLRSTMESLSLKLAETQEQLQKSLVIDPGSSLFNMWYIRRQLEEDAAHYSRYSRPFSMILAEFPESSGGEETPEKREERILSVSRLLKSELRTVDHMGRMDERRFLIILPQTGREEGWKVLEKMEKTLPPGTSARFALEEYHGQGIETLLSRAENGLFTLPDGTAETLPSLPSGIRE